MTYDELLAGGEQAIAQLLGKQETLQLEFKANEHREPIFIDGTLQKAGRRALAKEASAFANSAGGLIVFGVDCRKDQFGVDQAEKLTAIDSIKRAETTVRDAAAELLQPKHDGIRVASITSSAGDSSGYVLVDVPRSERRPHRSEAQGQKEYFKRIGSSSYPMEHYDIEDAFRRTASPVLSLQVSFDSYMILGNEADFKMNLVVSNTGEVTAKYLSIQVWDQVGSAFGLNAYNQINTVVTNYQGRTHIAGPADFVIHPGETKVFFSYSFRVRKSGGSVTFGGQPVSGNWIQFSYKIGAENMRAVDSRMEVTKADLGNVTQFLRSI